MRLNLRIILLAFTVLLGCSVLMSALSFRQFENSIEPAVATKVDALANAVEQQVASALDYGIPFEKLAGVEEFFDVLQKSNPEIFGLRLINPSSSFNSTGFIKALGRSEAETKTYPLHYEGKTIGQLEILVDGDYAPKKSLELLLDGLTVIIVSVIIAFELVIFIMSFNVSTRIQKIGLSLNAFLKERRLVKIPDDYLDEIGLIAQRINQRIDALVKQTAQTFEFISSSDTQRVDFIRWPFFLLIFSESLSLSFFPLYVGQLYMPDWGLSREFVVGLPISIFMFIWALSLPTGGVWSDTVGRRRAFIFGALLTSIGLILTAFAYSLFDLLLWRAVTAVGYGLVFITVQGFVTDHTSASNRNRGMAMFVATFFAGSLSGAAIGGIMADHISMSAILLSSALISLGAALFVARFIAGESRQVRPKLTFASIREVCLDRSFLMVTLFSAIPSKIALTGFLYFSAPIFLFHVEASKSTAGRAIMLYGLVIICLSPFIANYADRLRSRLPLVLSGGILGALAIAQMAIMPTLTGMMISIGLLGLAHATSVPSQLSFITETNKAMCERLGLGQVVGIFRLMERVGNILGPIIAGLFIAHFGLDHAFIWLALLIGAATLILAIWMFLQRPRKAQP